MVPDGFEKIPGFPLYFVSREGSVWSSMRERFLKPKYTNGGHKCTVTYNLVKLGKENPVRVSISKVVLTVFKEKQPPNTRVKYRDGDIHNVHIDNLEWVPVVGVGTELSKKYGTKTKPVTALDGEDKEVYPNVRAAADDLGLDPRGVLDCLKGNRKSSKGFKFRYSTEEEIRECDMDM